MACSCRKPKKPTATKPAPKPADTQNASKTQSFTLTTQGGRTLSFGSKLEADAANARSGYTGRVSRS